MAEGETKKGSRSQQGLDNLGPNQKVYFQGTGELWKDFKQERGCVREVESDLHFRKIPLSAEQRQNWMDLYQRLGDAQGPWVRGEEQEHEDGKTNKRYLGSRTNFS